MPPCTPTSHNADIVLHQRPRLDPSTGSTAMAWAQDSHSALHGLLAVPPPAPPESLHPHPGRPLPPTGLQYQWAELFLRYLENTPHTQGIVTTSAVTFLNMASNLMNNNRNF